MQNERCICASACTPGGRGLVCLERGGVAFTAHDPSSTGGPGYFEFFEFFESLIALVFEFLAGAATSCSAAGSADRAASTTITVPTDTPNPTITRSRAPPSVGVCGPPCARGSASFIDCTAFTCSASAASETAKFFNINSWTVLAQASAASCSSTSFRLIYMLSIDRSSSEWYTC